METEIFIIANVGIMENKMFYGSIRLDCFMKDEKEGSS